MGGCALRPNRQQSEAWNGPESAHYVDHADRYDRQLRPVTDALIERAALEPWHRVLDVGCGSGATALVAARHARSVLGVDLSAPLVAVATDRARSASLDHADFLVADAQTHEFDDESFDVLISQFGLMFFDEPVAACSNLRRALSSDGRLVFVAWQELDANEWLAPVRRAVAQFAGVPDLGGLARGAGMFALQDSSETAALLGAAGFTDVVVEPISPSLVLGGGGTADGSSDFLLGMGIVRGLLSGLAADQRERATDAIRAELLRRHEPGVGVRLGAGVWLVSGRVGVVQSHGAFA